MEEELLGVTIGLVIIGIILIPMCWCPLDTNKEKEAEEIRKLVQDALSADGEHQGETETDSLSSVHQKDS